MHSNNNCKKQGARKCKIIIFAVCALLIAVVGAGATVAFLSSVTEPVANVFVPAKAECEVICEDGRYTVCNTGDTEVYIRAAIVANWIRDSKVYALSTPSDSDYTVNLSGWTLIDGFYYYSEPIAPGESTDVIEIISTYTEAPNGCSFSCTLLAEAVQSSPASAVYEAWGYITDEN